MTKWEYKEISASRAEGDLETVLNAFGKKGWELVNFVWAEGERRGKYYKCILKQEIK